MPNRVYRDMRALRRDVEGPIDRDRYRITEHARTQHPELTDVDRVAIVRWGSGDKPDGKRTAPEGVYVCWLRHPRLGVCRGCFAVEETGGGDLVVVITAFQD